MGRAILDIGSNSVRLLLSDGRHFTHTTRLAAGLRDGLLDDDSMRRTAEAASAFCRAARESGDEPFAFATSAVRDARNGTAFAESLAAPCRILTGEEEAEAGYLGASRGGSCGVLDVGGASAEAAVGREGKVLWARSFPFGAVRCTLRNGQDVEKTLREAESAAEMCRGAFPPPPEWKAVGGTSTAFAAVRLRLRAYRDGAVEGCPLSPEEVLRAARKLAAMPLEERRLVPGMEKKRADILPSGLAVLGGLMRAFSIGAATVTAHDNLEGYRLLLERESGEK